LLVPEICDVTLKCSFSDVGTFTATRYYRKSNFS
jgi:hypothetical protein